MRTIGFFAWKKKQQQQRRRSRMENDPLRRASPGRVRHAGGGGGVEEVRGAVDGVRNCLNWKRQTYVRREIERARPEKEGRDTCHERLKYMIHNNSPVLGGGGREEGDGRRAMGGGESTRNTRRRTLSAYVYAGVLKTIHREQTRIDTTRRIETVGDGTWQFVKKNKKSPDDDETPCV